MNFLRVFILFQALFTLFVAGGLYFRGNSVKYKSLGLFTILVSLEIFYFLYGTSKIADAYPELYGRYYFSAGAMYGPLLYFHFKSILDKDYKLTPKSLIHLIPLIGLNIYMFNLLIMPTSERIIYYTNENNFYNCVIYLNYFRCIHQITYGILLIDLYKKHKNRIKVNTKFYLSGLSIIYFSSTIIISFLVSFANSWRDFSIYYLLNNFIVFIIAYVLYKDPKFFRDIKNKYTHSSINKKQLLALKEKISTLFKEEKPYLNKQFNIDSLAKRLDSKSAYLSQTFTTEFKENFNDFVNRYRIEYSKKLLKSSEHENLKIEAIAEESGFNNKVTFYKAFSKFENTTPSKYRKAQ